MGFFSFNMKYSSIVKRTRRIVMIGLVPAWNVTHKQLYLSSNDMGYVCFVEVSNHRWMNAYFGELAEENFQISWKQPIYLWGSIKYIYTELNKKRNDNNNNAIHKMYIYISFIHMYWPILVSSTSQHKKTETCVIKFFRFLHKWHALVWQWW